MTAREASFLSLSVRARAPTKQMGPSRRSGATNWQRAVESRQCLAPANARPTAASPHPGFRRQLSCPPLRACAWHSRCSLSDA